MLKYLTVVLLSINVACADTTMICEFGRSGSTIRDSKMLVTVDDRNDVVISTFDGSSRKTPLDTTNKYYTWVASDDTTVIGHSVDRTNLEFMMAIIQIRRETVVLSGRCKI